MEKVEFEEVPYLSRSITLGPPRTPAMISVLMKAGIIKTEKGARIFLIGTVIISIIASVLIFSYFVLGLTPESFWNKISGKNPEHISGVQSILLKDPSPEMRAKIENINKRR